MMFKLSSRMCEIVEKIIGVIYYNNDKIGSILGCMDRYIFAVAKPSHRKGMCLCRSHLKYIKHTPDMIRISNMDTRKENFDQITKQNEW